jgi:hypothetical protein
MITENPCYHCYRGAIGECVGCKYDICDYSGNLESKVLYVDDVSDDGGDSDGN